MSILGFLLGMAIGMVLVVAGVALLFRRFKRYQTDITLQHLGTIKTTHPGLALVFLGVVLFMLSLLSAVQHDELKSSMQELRRSQSLIVSFLDLTLLRNPAFGSYFRATSDVQQEAIIRKAIALLRPAFKKVTDSKQSDFRKDDFTEVTAICDFLAETNPTDGSALYYKGEVQRLLRRRYLMRESFSLYIKHAPESEKETAGLTALGYFDERTAWIHHLLANDFLCNAQQQTVISTKLDLLREVVSHVQDEAKYWPKGFPAGETTLSTADLLRVVADDSNRVNNAKCPSMS